MSHTEESSVVYDYTVNDECNGIQAEVGIIFYTYYLEVVVLPCDKAVEIVIEDDSKEPLYIAIYNKSESQTVDAGGYYIDITVVIIPSEYTMDVSVSL